MGKLLVFLVLGVLLISSVALVIADGNESNNETNGNECIEVNDEECCLGDVCTPIAGVDCVDGISVFKGCDDECNVMRECEDVDEDTCTVDSDCDSDETCQNGECEEEQNETDDDENGTTVTKTKTRGNKTTFLPWQKRTEEECPEGCKCRGAISTCPTENGKIMTIEAGRSGNVIIITIVKNEIEVEECEVECEEEDCEEEVEECRLECEDEEVEEIEECKLECEEEAEECELECEKECDEIEADTELEIEQENEQDEDGNNKTKLKVKLSNGRKAEIKIMPDTASERALERLRLKVCSSENNCVIELKEIVKGEDSQLAYEVKIERKAKILALFETKMEVKGWVDAETGEILKTGKPWWAFLATEPEE